MHCGKPFLKPVFVGYWAPPLISLVKKHGFLTSFRVWVRCCASCCPGLGAIFCKSMLLRACNGRKDTSLKPLLFEVCARAISIWFPSFEFAQLWNKPGSKFLEEARHLCETWRNQVRSSNEYIYIFIYLYLLISWWFCDMFTVWRQDLLSLM